MELKRTNNCYPIKLRFDDEEIDRMMKDAEANAEADKKRKEEVDLRNEVDQAIFATEKTIKETEGKGFDAERDAAQAAP